MTRVEQLKARFPNMFMGQNSGTEFYDGRLPIFVEACQQIDLVLGANKRGFHWVQIKPELAAIESPV